MSLTIYVEIQTVDRGSGTIHRIDKHLNK